MTKITFQRFYFSITIILFAICCNQPGEAPVKDTQDLDDQNLFMRLAMIDTVPVTTISFDKRYIDFGNVVADTLLSARFVFHNKGDHPLIIAYAYPDCYYTNFELSSDTVAPGESGWILLEYTSTRTYGTQHLRATIACNTPERFYNLTLKCIVDE